MQEEGVANLRGIGVLEAGRALITSSARRRALVVPGDGSHLRFADIDCVLTIGDNLPRTSRFRLFCQLRQLRRRRRLAR